MNALLGQIAREEHAAFQGGFQAGRDNIHPAGYNYQPWLNGGQSGGQPNSAMAETLAMIRKHEGFSSRTYWDVNAYRLGYGTDTITDRNGNVRRVRQGDTVTREDAERDLARRVQIFRNGARRKIGEAQFDRLPAKTQAAITSVAYNYGSLDKLPSLVTAARSGNINAISRAIAARQGDNRGVNRKRRLEEAAAVMSDLNSRPVGGQAVADNARRGLQSMRQGDAARQQAQQITNNSNIQLAINGGIHVQSSANTIDGTMEDASAAARNRLVQIMPAMV